MCTCEKSPAPSPLYPLTRYLQRAIRSPLSLLFYGLPISFDHSQKIESSLARTLSSSFSAFGSLLSGLWFCFCPSWWNDPFFLSLCSKCFSLPQCLLGVLGNLEDSGQAFPGKNKMFFSVLLYCLLKKILGNLLLPFSRSYLHLCVHLSFTSAVTI